MNITDERAELFKAIADAQGEFATVEKDGKNPHFNSKFAPLDSIIEMIRPIMNKHGLSVMQHCDIPESGSGILIETVIAHASGQYISGRLSMPAVKNDPQGYGSAITYARRYALGAALGIVSDEDVDGNSASTGTTAKPAAKAAPQQPAKPAELTEDQQKYFPRTRTALDSLFSTDIAAKKKEIAALTTFKGKDDKMVPGVDDYRKLDGQRLQILCQKLESTVAAAAKNAASQEAA